MVKPILGKEVLLYLKWTNDMGEYRKMGNISSISTITFAPPMHDSTEYGSLMEKRYIYGLTDGPEISIKFWGNADDYRELYDYFYRYGYGGINVGIILPDGYRLKFNAYVVNFSFDLPKDAIFETTLVVKPVSPIQMETLNEFQYEIIVTSDGGGTCYSNTHYAYQGQEIVLVKEPYRTHDFARWEVLEGGVEIKNDTFTMPNRNVKIQARFVEKKTPKYKINIMSDGEGICSANYTSATAGTTILLTAKPKAEYYKFDKWTVYPESIKIDQYNSFKMPAQDVNIVGSFVVNTDHKWDVTVVAKPPEGGTVSASLNAAYYGQEVALTAVEKAPYRFLAWNTKQGGIIIRDGVFKMPAEHVIIEGEFWRYTEEIKEKENDTNNEESNN